MSKGNRLLNWAKDLRQRRHQRHSVSSSPASQAPNDTSGITHSRQAQDGIQSATDVAQHSGPSEDLVQWKELWTKAYDKLTADEAELVKEYEVNLAKLQSPGQPEGFTINLESVRSIVAQLDRKREDEQWCLKWTTNNFSLNINLRKQVEKLVKVATWSDVLVKQALATQPHAALAWCAATMVLPVR